MATNDTASYRCPEPDCGEIIESEMVVDPTFGPRMEAHIASHQRLTLKGADAFLRINSILYDELATWDNESLLDYVGAKRNVSRGRGAHDASYNIAWEILAARRREGEWID